MCTVTIKYDEKNKKALSIIAMMMQSGLFEFEETPSPYNYDDFSSEEEEKSVFLNTAKNNMASIFARNLNIEKDV